MNGKAMILAAGLGTRLGAETAERPKILTDIGGITLLEWIIRKLVRHGFTDIIINIHHLADMIEEKAPAIAANAGASLTFSDERNKLLDTGGGLYNARHFFGEEPFVLYNGDIVTDLDIGSLCRINIETGAVATLGLRQREASRVFLTSQGGVLAGWLNRQSGERIMVKGWKSLTDSEVKMKDISSDGTSEIEGINPSGSSCRLRETPFTAISVIKPQIFRFMKEGVYSMRDVYLQAAASGLVNSYNDSGGLWIDIGTPESLGKCRELFSSGKSGLDRF
jgi:NDP-sugar pyrophosphorylase family protein